MPTYTVNFSAAFAATLFAIAACSPNGSTPRADASPGTAAAATISQSPTPAAPDPIVAAADHGRIQGDPSAKTWVIIASDFQCPYCKQWHSETYEAFLKEYVRSGKVKVAYVNYPLGPISRATRNTVVRRSSRMARSRHVTPTITFDWMVK